MSSSTPSAAPAIAPTANKVSPRRYKIYFQDDTLRERSEATARQLLKEAMDRAEAKSNSALLIQKALKYRKVYDRIEGIDVTSSEFDASKFLGVDWCKTPNLKEYCDNQQSQEQAREQWS